MYSYDVISSSTSAPGPCLHPQSQAHVDMEQKATKVKRKIDVFLATDFCWVQFLEFLVEFLLPDKFLRQMLLFYDAHVSYYLIDTR